MNYYDFNTYAKEPLVDVPDISTITL